MDDQANDLRRLVRSGVQGNAPSRPEQKLVLITSGKGGVGTTTLAISLAGAFAQQGHRTVLVDGNPHGGDVALLCGVSERWTLADLVLARCTLQQALQEGPAGIRVLPGAWGQDVHEEYSTVAQERLLEQLARLEPTADYVVLDAGSGSGRVLRRFWQAADVVVAVTTTDVTSVMDTYAAIKLLCPSGAPPSVLSLVNRVTDRASAQDVQQRLQQACRRFLGLGLESAGCVSQHVEAARATRGGQSLAMLRGTSGRELQNVSAAVLAAVNRNFGTGDWDGAFAARARRTA